MGIIKIKNIENNLIKLVLKIRGFFKRYEIDFMKQYKNVINIGIKIPVAEKDKIIDIEEIKEYIINDLWLIIFLLKNQNNRIIKTIPNIAEKLFSAASPEAPLPVYIPPPRLNSVNFIVLTNGEAIVTK